MKNMLKDSMLLGFAFGAGMVLHSYMFKEPLIDKKTMNSIEKMMKDMK